LLVCYFTVEYQVPGTWYLLQVLENLVCLSILGVFSTSSSREYLPLKSHTTPLKATHPKSIVNPKKMYGGLFGDLPATKKNDTGTTTSTCTTTTATTSCTSSSLSAARQEPNKVNSQSNDTDRKVHRTTIPPTMIVPHRIRPTVLQQQHHPTMRPQRQPQPQIRKRPISTLPQPPKVALSVRDSNNSIDTEMATAPNQPKSISTLEPTSTESATTGANAVFGGKDRKSDSDTVGIYPSTGTTGSIHPETEAQQELEDRLRILNERAIEGNDVYNPMIPNDVLVYWEQQVIRKEQEQYERERQNIIQEQEMIRQQLEQERNQLLQQAIQAEKDAARETTSTVTGGKQVTTTDPAPPSNTPVPNEYYQKIIQREQQRAIGRGRGNISNLPAWLIQKQQQPPSKETK
jgi:hypothetical protein